MKKLIVGVAAALSLMTSNAVADGPYRRPPPTIAAPAYEPPPPTWTGFYIGAGIGAGAVVTDVSVDDRILDERLFDLNAGAGGALGTLIVGWDWQLGPTTVFGVFADFDFFNFSHNNRVFDDFFRDSRDVDNAWSIGARLGWLSSPSTLWYVTGGYTQVEIDHSPRFADLVGVDGISVHRDSTLEGYFVGAGVDTRLAASNWFLRLEYRFSEFDTGSVRIRDDVAGVDLFRINADVEAHTARLTLTYKFTGGYGWGAWGR